MRNDTELLDYILSHIDQGTTDLGDEIWYEPVENYSSQARFDSERRLMRRLPIPFCPIAALPEPGSYVARNSAGVPIVVVRDVDGTIRAFRNASPLEFTTLHASTISCSSFPKLSCFALERMVSTFPLNASSTKWIAVSFRRFSE